MTTLPEQIRVLHVDDQTESAEAHGWEVSVRESDTGGARFEVIGIEST